jgi:hypothetical protein
VDSVINFSHSLCSRESRTRVLGYCTPILWLTSAYVSVPVTIAARAKHIAVPPEQSGALFGRNRK